MNITDFRRAVYLDNKINELKAAKDSVRNTPQVWVQCNSDYLPINVDSDLLTDIKISISNVIDKKRIELENEFINL